MNNSKSARAIDLSTVETAEYQQWIRLLEGVCSIQSALKEHPNVKGLKQARAKAYNVLADIQVLVDSLEDQPRYVA